MNTSRLIDITQIKYERQLSQRVLYPFRKLNRLTGGGELGGLVILFSKTNQGKSEATMQFIVKWISSGHKVLAMMGEHAKEKVQQLMYKKVSKYNPETWKTVKLEENGKETGVEEIFIDNQQEEFAKRFYSGNFFLYDTNKGFTLKDILWGFKEGLTAGCKVFVLDNQMMIDIETSNELLEQKDTTEKLRQWARKNNALIFMVSHSRKVEPTRIRLVETDINGSSNISNKATTIMTITRTDTLDINSKEYKDYSKLLEYNGIKIEETDSILEVVKEKNGVGLGFVPLKWNKESKVYQEVDFFGVKELEVPVLHIKKEEQIVVEDIF